MNNQITLIALSNPYLSLCFGVGGLLLMIGLAMATILPDGEYKNKGLTLMLSSCLIAFPAVIPMLINVIGGNGSIIKNWMILNYVPLVGILIGFYSWKSASKNKDLEFNNPNLIGANKVANEK